MTASRAIITKTYLKIRSSVLIWNHLKVPSFYRRKLKFKDNIMKINSTNNKSRLRIWKIREHISMSSLRLPKWKIKRTKDYRKSSTISKSLTSSSSNEIRTFSFQSIENRKKSPNWNHNFWKLSLNTPKANNQKSSILKFISHFQFRKTITEAFWSRIWIQRFKHRTHKSTLWPLKTTN